MNEDLHLRRQLRFFRGYAIVMSLVAAVFFLGAAGGLRSRSFDTISARRIDVTDENGNVRLALFGKDREPPPILAGKPFSGRAGGPNADAGLMFYSERRDEVGGLIYGAHAGPHGEIVQAQSLTFDAYKQDQEVQLSRIGDGNERKIGLSVNDAPNVSLETTAPLFSRIAALPENRRAAAIDGLRRKSLTLTPRVFAGVRDRDATFVLRDAAGHPRLTLTVGADGSPKIEFLDAAGRVVRTLS